MVGNSGLMLQSRVGADIDQYDAVIRMNNAPVGERYRPYVGTKYVTCVYQAWAAPRQGSSAGLGSHPPAWAPVGGPLVWAARSPPSLGPWSRPSDRSFATLDKAAMADTWEHPVSDRYACMREQNDV